MRMSGGVKLCTVTPRDVEREEGEKPLSLDFASVAREGSFVEMVAVTRSEPGSMESLMKLGSMPRSTAARLSL